MWWGHVPGKNSSWKFNNFVKHLHQSWATCKHSQVLSLLVLYRVKILKFLQCILWVIQCSSIGTTPFRKLWNKNGCREESFCAKVTPFWGRVVSASDFQSGDPGFECHSGHQIFFGCPKCKTLAKLLNSQLVFSCHLELFILLCSIRNTSISLYLLEWSVYKPGTIPWFVTVSMQGY